jgi:hypothetical protein
MTDDEQLAEIRRRFSYEGGTGYVSDIPFLLSRLDKARAEVARLTALQTTHEGHEQPCYYCGEPCNALAGNPGLWPVGLHHREDPGVVKWHHDRCVSLRLDAAVEPLTTPPGQTAP